MFMCGVPGYSNGDFKAGSMGVFIAFTILVVLQLVGVFDNREEQQ